MVNQQLLDYIKQQLAAGTAKDAIQQALVGQGWNVSDIAEAFAALVPQPAPVAPVAPQPAPATMAPLQTSISQPAAKPQSHLMLWILILVLLIASAGGAVAYYYYFMMQPAVQSQQMLEQDDMMLDADMDVEATSTSNPVTDATPAVNPADDTNPFTTQSNDNGYQNPF
ncbi:hypothetical protein K2Q08_03465 [Patescibacteria group bacterium]|nr:hypothetical protein [Patescibacteria group bacterium]